MRAVAVALSVAALVLSGCDAVECATDLFAGGGTYRGRANGATDDMSIESRSVRAACAEYCAKKRPSEIGETRSTKREDFGDCGATCEADVAAKRLGARTTCVEP